MLAIVPQAFGFWLVAGSTAGVHGPEQTRTFLIAAMLMLGAATLAQVVAGYRIMLYEGPASAYLAAVIVAAGAGHGLAAIDGGLLVAGALTALLGLLGLDRLIRRYFTPLTGMIFVLVVTVAVVPTTLERAFATSDAHPVGTVAGWTAGLTVLVIGVLLQRRRSLRPYALLGALIAGTLVEIAVGGVPAADLSGGVAPPPILPWGPLEFSLGSILPFIVAAALIAFNTVAAVEVSSEMLGVEKPSHAAARGLVVNGVAQGIGAIFGNVLGSVSRLDSVPIVQLIGNRRRAALGLAAIIVMALSFVEPFIGLVAALPLNVSAAMLALMLGSMIVQTARRLWPLGPRARWIAAAALAPSVAWTPLQHSLSAAGQLLGNPMLWGVLIGLTLEHTLARRTAPALQTEGRS